jgi:hypothetical protein
MSWIENIQNPSVKSNVNSSLADSSVSYAEMLNLLTSIAQGGVTASELADLKLIDSNYLAVYSSEYLRTISRYLIYSNPANDKWWGGATFYADVRPLGDLTANFSQDASDKLIGKWFLGTDLPMPIAGGDSATGTTGNFTFSYAKASGPLFVSGPAASDVTQGSAGSCYLVASLGAIANANPSLITNMFVDNQNDTYGVKFYSQGGSIFTTVDEYLPVQTNNAIAFSGNSTKSLSGELWVSLAEKAYAQLNSQDGALADNEKSGINSYQAIEGGFAQPLKQIANLNYKYYSSYFQGIPDSLDSGEHYSANSSTYKQTLINGLNSGAVGWLGSWGETYGTNGKRNFVSGHAYMLLDYNSATDKFVVRNPWGGDGSSNYNPQFEVSIDEFWNPNIKGLVALSDAIASEPVYSYTLTNNSNSTSPVSEGTLITFTVTRSASGSASTVYVNTRAGTADEGDYEAISNQAVSFAAYETSRTVNVNTYWDTLVENKESFQLDLFKSVTDTSATTTSTAYVKDGASGNYDYTLATSAGPTNPVTEGGQITFTITRSNSGSASTVYFRTALGTASSNDYATLDQQAVSFASYETSKTFTVNTYQDSLTEGTEFFYVGLYKNYSDSIYSYSTYSWGYIKDAPVVDYTYSVSSAATSSSPVTEGGKVSFTITRSSTGSPSTVYVSTVPGTASNSDYGAFSKQAVEFAAYETSKTVSVDIHQDWWSEGPEYFYLGLFKNFADGFYDYSTYGVAYIVDTPVAAYNYMVTSNATSANPVTEGNPVSFTITRSGTGTASTVYVSTSEGTADWTDFTELDTYPVSFASYETSKTVTVGTYADAQTEGNEYFWLDLYKNYGDATWTTYGSAEIKDAAVSDYTYSVSSNATSANPVTEGNPVSFTITRSGTGTASTVYVSTSEGTADWTDFTELDMYPVSFASYETSKTVTVGTYADAQTEGNEYFWLDLYKNYGDATWATYGSAEIKDAAVSDYTYSVSSNATSANPVTEGDPVSFTVTRSGTGTASTVYVSTSEGTADWTDFTELDMYPVSFASYETSKTVTVGTYADAQTEGNEYFWLDLYKNYGDATWATYGSAEIKDAAVSNYTYSVSSNATSANPVTEGNPVSFTITRSGTGTASTVYVSTSEGTADWTDFTELDMYPVSFASYETSKTVTVGTYADAQTEGNEYFWLDLYNNYGDATWATYGSAEITDYASLKSSPATDLQGVELVGIASQIEQPGF